MTIRKTLGLFLAFTPTLGFCIDSPLSLQPATEQPKLGAYQDHIQLAAVETQTIAPETSNTIYNPEYPNLFIPTTPDRDGLASDTKLFLLYQVSVVGILYLMPESISQWNDEDKTGNIFRKWDDNVSNLRKDKDDWGINYIGHPYFGATYYVRARHRGYSRQNSFWYAALMSTLYEYGIEALFEPASVQDMVFTPVGGAIVGEYLMVGREKLKRNIAAKGYSNTSDNVLLFFTDPLGSINAKVNQWFGHNKENQAQLELLPIISLQQGNARNIKLKGLQAMYRW